VRKIKKNNHVRLAIQQQFVNIREARKKKEEEADKTLKKCRREKSRAKPRPGELSRGTVSPSLTESRIAARRKRRGGEQFNEKKQRGSTVTAVRFVRHQEKTVRGRVERNCQAKALKAGLRGDTETCMTARIESGKDERRNRRSIPAARAYDEVPQKPYELEGSKP